MANRGQQRQQQPRQPRVVINLTLGDHQIDNGVFKLPLLAQVVRDGQNVGQAEVRFRVGVNKFEPQRTDANGECEFEFTTEQKDQPQTIELTAILSGQLAAERKVTITVPGKAQQQKQKDDPESLVLYRHEVSPGVYCVFARVTKVGGDGMKTKVQIVIEGNSFYLETDDQGNADFLTNETRALGVGVVEEGKSIVVKGTVSGIKQAATLKIRRLSTRPPADDLEGLGKIWGTNNRRALLFLALMVVFWILCFFIGWGNPVFGTNAPAEELTTAQTIYNQVLGTTDPSMRIPAPMTEDKGDWQKYCWLFSLVWTLFALIYAPLSLREEVAEGLQEAFQKITEKNSAKADDPLYQRIAAWSGSLAAARPAGAVVQQAEKSESKKDDKAGSSDPHAKIGFLKLLGSDVLAEIITEAIPAISKNIFR